VNRKLFNEASNRQFTSNELISAYQASLMAGDREAEKRYKSLLEYAISNKIYNHYDSLAMASAIRDRDTYKKGAMQQRGQQKVAEWLSVFSSEEYQQARAEQEKLQLKRNTLQNRDRLIRKAGAVPVMMFSVGAVADSEQLLGFCNDLYSGLSAEEISYLVEGLHEGKESAIDKAYVASRMFSPKLDKAGLVGFGLALADAYGGTYSDYIIETLGKLAVDENKRVDFIRYAQKP
jgi:hypothetical protein